MRSGAAARLEVRMVGLDNAPAAFLKLFDGANFGKLLVRVSPDPTRRAG